VVAVIEKDGAPIHVGRSRRIVPPRMRRLLQLRDGGCRYPGCTVPARDTEGHHVIHWLAHGETELDNLVSLCRFHHHRHHDGAFDVKAAGDQFRFVTGDGRPIGPTPLGDAMASRGIAPLRDKVRVTGHDITASTPIAGDHGRRFDLDHAIIVLAGNIELAAQRSGQQRAGR
jgi:hypothetical protein